MSKLLDLAELGQSIWLDYIRRDILDSGELNQLHQTGVRGVTSNPSIFEQAIAHSDDYDDAFAILAAEDRSPKEIYEALAIEDIQRACDIFADLFRQTGGADGYISLEANPQLAYETEGTIAEARRLFAAVDRPNVYIKVPATPEGIPAIRQLISEGINVNITLIFAISAYEAVAEAYLAGLEELVESGGDPHDVSSVASFFVSRVDGKVDKMLEALGNESLRGTIGIANAKMAYRRFQKIFSGPRWENLAEKGARLQRPLWGSTSTKDPAYPDTLYVDNLIGPHTVNTVPPETLEAILDHANVMRTVDRDVDIARQQLEELAALGISLEQVTDELLDEGVEKFAGAYTSLLEAIAKRKQKHEGLNQARQQIALDGNTEDVREVRETIASLQENDFLDRLWQKDFTLWSDEPVEIENRLGWLDSARTMQQEVSRTKAVAEALVQEGYDKAVLLGMGGSSLAPEFFARTFGVSNGYLQLEVLDSTDPAAISAVRMRLNPRKTVFIVSSKSGTTIETISLFKYFYNWLSDTVDSEKVGRHFIAITDEGSKLAEIAQQYNFRELFLNDPNIGGRYSALSLFGLVPAALLGVDVDRLLANAQKIGGPHEASKGLWLGAIFGAMACAGRDKLTIISSSQIASFGDWAEQLIAESTGKNGEGVLPVVGEPLMAPEQYGKDRLFVYLRLKDGTGDDEAVKRIKEAGHPVVTIHLDDDYALGQQLVIWQVATAVAGHLIGINPFNQPNVESAKRRAKEMIASLQENGSLPVNESYVKVGGIEVQDFLLPADTPAEALHNFLDGAHPNGYVAVHAYVRPTPETDSALAEFRYYLHEQTELPVTVGYGPRFLHSTGQLHKGDAGKGIFIQLVSDPLHDLPIPDEPGKSESTITFGALKVAQALGDAQALHDADRRVIRFFFGEDTSTVIAALMED